MRNLSNKTRLVLVLAAVLCLLGACTAGSPADQTPSDNMPAGNTPNDTASPQDPIQEEPPGVVLSFDTADFEEIAPGEYTYDWDVFIDLETYPSLSDEAYDKDGIEARIKSIEESDIVINETELSTEYLPDFSYPVWLVKYEKGSNEDTQTCTDLYFQTDANEYRVHVSMRIDIQEDFQWLVDEKLATVTLEEIAD